MGVKGGGGQQSSQNSSVGQNTGQSNGANAAVGMQFGQTQSGNQSQQNSSSSSFNSAQSTQDIWGAQAPHLENVYGSATDQYGQAIDTINGLQPQVQNQVQDAYAQGNAGYGNQLQGGFAQGLQGQVGPNSYVNSLAGDMMSDAQKIKAQNLQGIDARAAAAGMSGSSGYHNSANQMANNVDEQTMQGMNQLRFNAYDRGVQNNMQLAGMMDQNQQFGVANMGNMQQGAMNQFNPAMAGLNATGAYGQIIGGPTTLTQSSSSGGSSSSSNATSSGFSDSVNYGMNQSGGYTGANNYGTNAGQGASNGWNANAGVSYV